MIEQKEKICIRCGEPRKIFSKGRCKSCAQIDYQKKADEKRKEKAKSKGIAIASNIQGKTTSIKKTPTKKYKEQKSEERDAMLEHWTDNADELGFCYCKECLLLGLSKGQASLGDTMNPYNLAHIISKGANKSFQNDKRNFILLCADHHNQFDGQFEGKTRKDMKVYPITEAIRMMLKQEDSKKF